MSLAETRSDTGVWDRLVQEDRVHRRLYTDPAIFEMEMTKIFGATWVYLGHETEIPEPNDFRTGRLGLRPIILTRDGDGQVHALLNRCRHRAARVCREACGSADRFTCGYHGWVYSNDGRLLAAPFPKAFGPDFDASDFSLARIPRVSSYRGFLFGTLNPAAAALRDHLGPAAEFLDQWIDRSPQGRIVVGRSPHRMVYRGNWKLAYDNAGDGYHPGFSHESLIIMAAHRAPADENTDMLAVYAAGDPDSHGDRNYDLGNGHTLLDQRPGIFPSKWMVNRPQPGREYFEAKIRATAGEGLADRMLEEAVGSAMNLNIFPNLLVIGNQIQVVEPLDVRRTQLTWYPTTIQGVPPDINTLRLRTQEDFPSFGEVDDNANFEECQQGLEIPEIEWIYINRHLRTGVEETDERGVVSGPLTDDLHLRAYYRQWKHLMSAEPELVVE